MGTVDAPIQGFPGYRVTSDGKVWSAKKGGFLSPRLVNGYHHVTLCRPGQKQSRSIHRLVAEAFIRGMITGEVVNHLDGDRTNNRIENIEITSPSANVQHAYDTGLRVINQAHRERAAELGKGRRVLSAEQVKAIRRECQGKRGEIASLARAYGTHHKTVRAILDGRAFGDVK